MRLNYTAPFSFLVLSCAAHSCFAQHVVSLPECEGLANAPTGECFSRAYEKADGEVQALLKQIHSALNRPEDRMNLDAAEQAWVKYRDLTCDAESQVYFDHGSGEGTARGICLVAETRLRLADLHAIYDWQMERMRN